MKNTNWKKEGKRVSSIFTISLLCFLLSSTDLIAQSENCRLDKFTWTFSYFHRNTGFTNNINFAELSGELTMNLEDNLLKFQLHLDDQRGYEYSMTIDPGEKINPNDGLRFEQNYIDSEANLKQLFRLVSIAYLLKETEGREAYPRIRQLAAANTRTFEKKAKNKYIYFEIKTIKGIYPTGEYDVNINGRIIGEFKNTVNEEIYLECIFDSYFMTSAWDNFQGGRLRISKK